MRAGEIITLPCEVLLRSSVGGILETKDTGLQRPSLGRNGNEGDIPVRGKGAQEASFQSVSRLVGGCSILSAPSGRGADRCCGCPGAWERRPHVVVRSMSI